jgi:hypothetical protein
MRLAFAHFCELPRDRFGETPKPAGKMPTLPETIQRRSAVFLLNSALHVSLQKLNHHGK